MATTIFTPSMLKNGTRGVPEIPKSGGGDTGLATVSNAFSMAFSGTDDYFVTNYNANLIGTTQSFSMWFKSISTGIQYKTLMGQYQENILHGWGIEIGQPGNLDKITWYSRNQTIDRTSYGSALTQNQWYHLVLVINSAGLNNVDYSIYLDGNALVENATSNYYDNTTVLDSFQINNRYASEAFYGGGNFEIDEVAVFTSSLDASTVESIYSASLPLGSGVTGDLTKLNTPPVAWYRMGD